MCIRNRLNFQLYQTVKVGDYDIPCDPYFSMIREDSKLETFVKNILCPVFSLRNYYFVDGFIEREVGKFIKKYIKPDTFFLEVGCGDMSLRRFLPEGFCYNALDISLSEFHLKRVLPEGQKIKVGLASSATRIPLQSDTASLIVSTETFEHIPDIDKAVSEIYRVLKPEGILLVSIPNNYCHKYHKKGPHIDHLNNWTFDGFKDCINQQGFQSLEGYMKGYWIPLPLWLTKTSYQLPISSETEFYNTNFFFAFQKPDSI